MKKAAIRGETNNYDEWHLYVYCANNPINYTDPTGHWKIRSWIVADLIDFALAFIGFGVAFALYKVIMKNAWKSGKLRKKAIQAVSDLSKKFSAKQGSLCKAIYNKAKAFLGKKWAKYIKNYIVSKTFSSVRDWIAEKLVKNISMFFSIGSFFTGMIEYSQYGYRTGYIWK